MTDEAQAKVKTFNEWREEFLAVSKSKNIDGLNSLTEAVKATKGGISEKERELILNGITLALEDIRDGNAQQTTKIEPEKEILHDEIMPRKKVVATAERVNGLSYLGYIVTFSVGSCAVPIEKVEKFWEKHHIEGWMRPHSAHPQDAFARACATLVREESSQINDRQISVKWNSTRLSDDTYMITRRIINAGENGQNDLGWKNIIRIRLNKPSSEEGKGYSITAEPQGNTKDIKTAAQNVEAEIRATYDLYMTNIVDKQIRDALRNTIYKSDGINLSSGRGGSWFVPLRHQARLVGWKDFAKMVNSEHLSGSFPVTCRTYPVTDETEYQEYVREDVAREVRARMEATLTETLEALEKQTERAREKGVDADKNEAAIDGILARKLEAHAQTLDLLDEYKELLRGKIKIDLSALTERIEKVEVPLSARHQTALRKLVSLQKPSSVRIEKSATKLAIKKAEAKEEKQKVEEKKEG